MSRRLPLEPLLTFTRLSPGQLAVLAGYTYSAGGHWRTIGVDVDQADELAIAVGSHPAVLWPEWCEFVDELEAGAQSRRRQPRGFIRERSGPRGRAFELRVYIGRDPHTGKERHRTCTVRGSRDDAERALQELVTAAYGAGS